MPQNLKITHAMVGPFLGGQVVPTSAVEGGLPECDRLVAMQAAVWTDEEANVKPPAARTAVAEMPDDELTRENERLRAENERMKAELEAARGTTAADPADATTLAPTEPEPATDAGQPVDAPADPEPEAGKKKRRW